MFRLILLKLIILITVIIIFCNNSTGQNNASFIASATIMAPENNIILQSAYYVRFSKNVGSNKILINNDGLCSLDNPIEFKTPNSAIATFYIPGDFLYYITLPQTDIILKRIDGEETISLSKFNIISQRSNDSNISTLAIVAFLNLNLKPISGEYNALSPLPITLHYN